MSVALLEPKKSQVNKYNMMGDLPVITEHGNFDQFQENVPPYKIEP